MWQTLAAATVRVVAGRSWPGLVEYLLERMPNTGVMPARWVSVWTMSAPVVVAARRPKRTSLRWVLSGIHRHSRHAECVEIRLEREDVVDIVFSREDGVHVVDE